MNLACSQLKDLILREWGEGVFVDDLKDRCAITLPLVSLDDRHLTVYVEPGIGDTFHVHDGGKTSSELYSLGIHLGDQRAESLRQMARRMGATFVKDVFQTVCKEPTLVRSVLAIAQCASLAMADVLHHKLT